MKKNDNMYKTCIYCRFPGSKVKMKAVKTKSRRRQVIKISKGATQSVKNPDTCSCLTSLENTKDLIDKVNTQVWNWTVENVKDWVIQMGYEKWSSKFVKNHCDGDLLLSITEEQLDRSIGIKDSILRKRHCGKRKDEEKA